MFELDHAWIFFLNGLWWLESFIENWSTPASIWITNFVSSVWGLPGVTLGWRFWMVKFRRISWRRDVFDLHILDQAILKLISWHHLINTSCLNTNQKSLVKIPWVFSSCFVDI